MIFVSDLDDCLLNTSKDIMSRLEFHFGIAFDWEKIYDYSIEKSFCLDKEIVSKFVTESLQGWSSKPIEGAVATFNLIAEKYFPAYILSHRRSYLYEHTKRRLDDLGFRDYKLILTHEEKNPTPDKARIINELEADIVIEDRPDTINSLYKNTNSVVLIYDRPWNRGIDENHRVKRVWSWYHLYYWYFGGDYDDYRRI